MHRTWTQALIHNYWDDYAAIIVDSKLSFDTEWDDYEREEYISSILVKLPFGKILLENQRFFLLVFDSKQEVVLQWIP